MNDGRETIIYIDGDHAVHTNYKGYSGLFVTQRKEEMINLSKN